MRARRPAGGRGHGQGRDGWAGEQAGRAVAKLEGVEHDLVSGEHGGAGGGQAADRAAARGAALALERALPAAAAGPQAGDLPADALLGDDLHQPGAAAGGVLPKADGKVERPAGVVGRERAR
ncbi:MAG TPA: hypothetical protein VGM21_00405, partial [Actinomycetota bacterium]